MKPEIIQKQNIAETDHLNLVMTSYSDKNKNIAQWVSVERPNNTQAVVIVAIIGYGTESPKLVVTREFRVPIQDYEYGFAAGLIEPGETILNAAEREFKEETGLSIKNIIRHPSPLIYNSSGLTNEGCYLIYVEAEGIPHNRNTEASEDITIECLSQSAVSDLMNDAREGKISIGAKTWIIMERFVKHGDI